MRKFLPCLLFFSFTNTHPWFWNFSVPEKPFIIALEAQGNTLNHGRTIDGIPENKLTLALAHALKKVLPEIKRSIQVVVCIMPEEAGPRAITADAHISLGIFEQKDAQASVYLYQFYYADSQANSYPLLSFYSADKLYRKYESLSTRYNQQIKTSLEGYALFKTYGINKIPFKPLLVNQPALGIEIGISKNSQLESLIVPLAHSIAKIAS